MTHKCNIANCFKNKVEATEQVNYRRLKLLEQMMKIFERVIKQKIREMVDLNTMQFGFMLGKGTMDAIFIGHQLQERHLDRKVYFEQVSG